MNKKTIAIVVLAVLVVVIVGVIVWDKKVAKAPEVQSVGVSTSTIAQVTSMPTSTMGSGALTVALSSSTTEKYSGSSFSFDYPSSWSIYSAMPLFMTNFDGNYKADGVIPAGGIQLGVVTTTISGNSITPAFMNCRLSPEPGWTQRMTLSTAKEMSASD